MREALLDTCVLFPIILRDTLLDAADAGFYLPRWTGTILEELRRNLATDRNLSPIQSARLVAALQQHFPEAAIREFEHLIPLMGNHLKDRHVLAAAVQAGIEVIVTDNLGDFPDAVLDPLGVMALSADEFLTVLFDTEPEQMKDILVAQAAGYHKPVMTFDALLARLQIHAPTLIARLVNEVL